MSLYEQLGREADRANALHNEYRKLLAVVDQVASGKIAASRLSVDLVNESWALAAPSPAVPMPAPQPPAE